jgi:hypothetical protein
VESDSITELIRILDRDELSPGLNPSLPEVRRLPGAAGNAAPAFEPLPIRGEALSATVLRERR